MTKPGPDRRHTYEYRRRLAEAQTKCGPTNAQSRVLLLDGDEHLRDISSVRVVRVRDCRIEWLEGCSPKSPLTYGAPAPSKAPTANTIRLEDELDLFEQLRMGTARFAVPLRSGTPVLVESIVASERQLGLPVERADLEGSDACVDATHWISAIEYGALRVNVDPPPNPSEHHLDAQKAFELGSFAACRRAEDGACAAAIAVTLLPLPPRRVAAGKSR
jgi:hypothetical protein